MARRSRMAVRNFFRRSGGRSLQLRKQLPRLLFLIGRQVLPGFHALQNAVLLLRRQAAETLQALAQ